MLKKSADLEQQIQRIKSKLKHYPKGKIISARNGKYFKWTHSDGKNHRHIKKADRKFAEQLAAKKYLTEQLHDLSCEKRAIDSYLRLHKLPPGGAEELLANPAYQDLLIPFFQYPSDHFSEWMNAPYDKNSKNPENLILKSISGNYVRSKSELMIDMFLYTNNIPFRYECALQLGELTIYPDFTILHPKTGKIFYWEHFGLMDDPSYCQRAMNKIRNYTSQGIYISNQLIITCETKEQPLDTELIKKIVQTYFLD